MKSPLQRRTAIAALLLAPTLAACGFSAQTDKVYQPANGVSERTGSVGILNAQIVSGADGTGTFIATLDNTGAKADSLTGLTGEGITAKTKGVEVPAGSVVNLAAAPESGNPVQVQVDGEGVQAGTWVRLTFAFESGQSTELLVPVVGATDDYQDVPLPSDAPSTAAAE